MSIATGIWSGEVLLRLLGDLVSDLKLSSVAPSVDTGFDSLDRLTIANELADFFDVRASGLEDLLLTQSTMTGWRDIILRSRAHDNSLINFKTSGSTGHPKMVTHRLDDIVEEAVWLGDRFRTRRRIVSLVPCHHIYGFIFSVVLAHVLGVPCIDARGRLPKSLPADLVPGDLVVGHPFILQHVFATAAACRPDIEVVSSTAPSTPDLWAALRGAGISRITEIYGSSESGGVGIRQAYDAPFTLIDLWQKMSDDVLRRSDGREVALQDRITWLDPKTFRVEGRKDAAVQVGGYNVFPGRVEQVLKSHPDVLDAAVRLMTPKEGTRLKAFVVLRDGRLPDVIQPQLHHLLEDTFDAPHLPKSYVFGDSIPCDSKGKRIDWAI